MTTFYDMLVLNLQRFPKNMKLNFYFDFKTLYTNPNKCGEYRCGKDSFKSQMSWVQPSVIDNYVDVTYKCKGTRLVYDFYIDELRVIDSKDVMTVGELLVILDSIKDKPHFLNSSIGFDNMDSLLKLNKELKDNFYINGDNLDNNLHDDMSTCSLNTKLEELNDNEYFFTLEVSNPNLLTINFYVYSSF